MPSAQIENKSEYSEEVNPSRSDLSLRKTTPQIPSKVDTTQIYKQITDAEDLPETSKKS